MEDNIKRVIDLDNYLFHAQSNRVFTYKDKLNCHYVVKSGVLNGVYGTLRCSVTSENEKLFQQLKSSPKLKRYEIVEM